MLDKSLSSLLQHINPLHLKKEGVSQQFLTRIIECFPETTRRFFLGVFMLDQFIQKSKTIKNDQWTCILNLITSAEARQGITGHFVVLLKKNDYFMYLDPFGLPALHESLRQFFIEQKNGKGNLCHSELSS